VAYKDIDLKPVTLSVGVAQLEENETAEALIKRADVAMYEAKRHGGNVVIAHRRMAS
jgi:PleD family two-component response regulator